MHKIYLAARYPRRQELCGYASRLRTLGHVVTSRWLDDPHGFATLDTGSNLLPHTISALVTQEDIDDLQAADLVVAFTEAPDSPYGRGGRHVECGLALAWGKDLLVCGPCENAFYALPQVWHATTFAEVLTWLAQEESP